MIKWIHHLLTPHCPDCMAEAIASKECKSCDSLMHQLELANVENRRLVDLIAGMNKPQPMPTMSSEAKPVTPPASWKVIKQQLEADDRKQAQLMREKAAESATLRPAEQGLKATINNEIENLERELGVE